MAVLTRTNPTAVARGTIQELASVGLYKVVLTGSGLSVNASDASAAKLSDALGGMAQIIQFKSNGLEIYMVADNHGIDIDTVAVMHWTVYHLLIRNPSELYTFYLSINYIHKKTNVTTFS